MLKFFNLFIKDFCRIMAKSAIYILVVIIISLLSKYFWGEDFALNFTTQNAYILNSIRFGSLGIWGVFFVFAAIMVVIITCQWFGEDILTNRSYLNHMLPVYTWELVVSKALAGLFVMLIAVCILTIDVVAIADSITIVKDLMGIIPDLTASDGLNVNITAFILLGVYYMLTLCLVIMSTAFLSLSLGQFFSKGFGRNFIIFVGFFALLIMAFVVLWLCFSISGITLNLAAIEGVQSIFDLASNILKCISNTNLMLSLLYLVGSSLILTYRLNV